MGQPKALLPFGPEAMLQRVYRLLREVVSPIVVVASEDQELPDLPPEAIVVRDQWPDCGPLAGLGTGISTLRSHRRLVYVTGCDVPLLQPAFVRHLLELAPGFEAVAPRDDQFTHPLSAVYDTGVLPVIEDLLSRGDRRSRSLLEHIKARYVPLEELRPSDRQLGSLRNLNQPAEYLAALAEAGFEVDPAVQAALRTG
jgi:molybdopterin-guanine dinucleotide biosynthesis protein A